MCVLPSRALAHLEALSGARARRSKLSLLACAAISVACVAQLARCLNSARPVPYAVPALMPAPMVPLHSVVSSVVVGASCWPAVSSAVVGASCWPAVSSSPCWEGSLQVRKETRTALEAEIAGLRCGQCCLCRSAWPLPEQRAAGAICRACPHACPHARPNVLPADDG